MIRLTLNSLPGRACGAMLLLALILATALPLAPWPQAAAETLPARPPLPGRLPLSTAPTQSSVLMPRLAGPTAASSTGLGGLEPARVAAAPNASGGWSTLARPLPTPRVAAQALTDGAGNIWGFGGRGSNSLLVPYVEAYEAATGKWYCSVGDPAPGCDVRTLAPMPTPRVGMAAAVRWADGLFFLMGGVDQFGTIVRTIEIYSPGLNRWYCSLNDVACPASSWAVYPLPTPRAFAAGVTGPNGAVYVVGGFDTPTTVTAKVEAWDPSTQWWYCSWGDSACGSPYFERLAPLPTPRSAMAAVTGADNGIYVIGGMVGSGTPQPVGTVEAYDAYANRWYCSAPAAGCSPGFTPPAMPTPRSDVAAAVGPDGRIYVAGGQQSGSILSTVEAYDPARGIWEGAAALPSARGGSAAVATGDRLFLLGGMSTFNDYSSVGGWVAAYAPPPPATPSSKVALEKSYPSTPLPLSQLLLTAGARYDGQPTNTVFGNYTYQHTDLSMPGFGPPVKLTRTYSSAYPRRTIFGWGWSATFINRLTFDGTHAQVTRDDGRVDSFTWTGAGFATDARGSVDTLVYDGGTKTYTLSTRQHLRYRFDAAGRMLAVADADGNTVTLQYTNEWWTGITDAAGRQWQVGYSPAGLVTSVTDPTGRRVWYAYNANDELVSATDPAGGVIQYTYDTLGKHMLLNVVDENGHQVVANYYQEWLDGSTGASYYRIVGQIDARGGRHAFYYFGSVTAYQDPVGAVSWTFYDDAFNVVFRVDPLGQVRQFSYSGDGLIAAEKDGNGGITRYSYDSRGNMLTSTDPLGSVTQMQYDARDNLTRKVDPLGHATSWTYNAGDHPTSTTDALGKTTTYAYDAHGQQTGVTDPLGHTTTYAYDASGNRTATTDPVGNTARVSYYGSGMPQTRTDALGHATTTTYDLLNRPLSVTAPDGGVTRYTYDKAGNRLTAKDPLGNQTTSSYDAANNLVKTVDALGNSTTYEYDLANRQITRTAPDGGAWRTTYDPAGRKIRETSALCTGTCVDNPPQHCDQHPGDCHTTLFTYDAAGNLTGTLDPARNRTSFEYDKANRLTAVTDALSNTLRLRYDAAGNRIAVTDPRGAGSATLVSYAYDALNRQVRETNAIGQSSATEYDAAGHVSATTNGAGERIAYAYDAAGRLLTSTAGGKTTSFAYDTVGNRTSMVDAHGTTRYAYDVNDRLLSASGPEGTISYAYDLAGNRTALGQPGQEVSYAYDALNRLASVQVGGSPAVTYGYDAAGRPISQTFGNGVSTELSYDREGRLLGLGTRKGTTEMQRIAYTLDALGNRTAEQSTGFKATYGYDALSRLTAATLDVDIAGGPPPGGVRVFLPLVRSDNPSVASGAPPSGARHHTYGYSYDALGNRLSATLDGSTVGYSYDAANRLTSVGGTAVANDAAGRLTDDGSHRYTYDPYDRLTAIAGADAATFQYDGDGNRVGETAGGTTTTYLIDTAAGLPVRIAAINGGARERYVYGSGRVLEVAADGGRRYEHGDGLGSMRMRTGADGAVLDAAAFAPFGERLAGAGPFGFTGEPSTGPALVHLRAREYSPALGRFLTGDAHAPDPRQPLSYNPYTYAFNNPVNLTDHAGLWPSIADLIGMPAMFNSMLGPASIPGLGTRSSSWGGSAGFDPIMSSASSLGIGSSTLNCALYGQCGFKPVARSSGSASQSPISLSMPGLNVPGLSGGCSLYDSSCYMGSMSSLLNTAKGYASGSLALPQMNSFNANALSFMNATLRGSPGALRSSMVMGGMAAQDSIYNSVAKHENTRMWLDEASRRTMDAWFTSLRAESVLSSW